MSLRPGLPPLHSYPLLWLLLASGLVALFLWRSDYLVPVRDPDTISYEHPVLPQHGEHDRDIEHRRLHLALGGTRTLLYPAFLDLVAPFTPDYGRLPRIQWALLTLALAYFWYAAAVFSGSRWLAFAVALPLVFPPRLLYANWVMPEALAAAFGLAAIASVLLLARRPSSRAGWFGLTLATPLAYHAKPVMQALVVLLPLLAPLLRLLIERRPRLLGRWTLGLGAATALPLLLYCTLRLAVVGHFGLVAFSGYNAIGVAANFLDADLVAALPDEHRPLARAVLEQRAARGLPPYTPDRRLQWWRQQVADNQWDIAEPAARALVAEEIASGRAPEAAGQPISLVIDRKLAGLSRQVLSKRPRLYLEWVVDGFSYGAVRFLDSQTARWLLVPLLVTLAVAGPVALVRRRAGPATVAGGTRARAVLGIGLVGVGFFLANLALIVLVSWPFERYLDLAAMLVPSVMSGAIFALWAAALRGLGGRFGGAWRRWEPGLARLEVVVLAAATAALGAWWLLDRLAPALPAERIWLDAAAHPPGRPAVFYAVRDFWLPAAPTDARLLLDTAAEYRVLVNGALVGSNRGARDDRLDAYRVGDLLRRRDNRLVVELRSLDGGGSLLCRLDADLAGRPRWTVVSDAGWATVHRYQRELLRARGPLVGQRRVRVLSSHRRGALRPGPRLPRADELLSAASPIAPRRFRVGLRGGAWGDFDPDRGSRRTRVTFDWGELVTGFLNLEFKEAPAALVYLGAEPPDPRRDRAQALALPPSGLTWTDVRPRRFRYATVVSTVRVAGARVDRLKPEWAARLIAAPEPTGTGPAPSPSLEKIWRELERASRQSGQTTRIIGSPTSTTSTSSGRPMRQ